MEFLFSLILDQLWPEAVYLLTDVDDAVRNILWAARDSAFKIHIHVEEFREIRLTDIVHSRLPVVLDHPFTSGPSPGQWLHLIDPAHSLDLEGFWWERGGRTDMPGRCGIEALLGLSWRNRKDPSAASPLYQGQVGPQAIVWGWASSSTRTM